VITFSLGICGTVLRFGVGFALSLLVAGIIAANTLRFDSEVHPLFGGVPKAGQIAWNHLEGDGEGHWTSNGVRRASLPVESDGPPILLVGNSFTEGQQVTDEEHYGHLLERELRLKGKYIPVLSFGKSGCSVPDYVASAKNLQAVFKPRWTVIQVQAGDFLGGSWREASPGSARFVRGDGQSRIKVVVQPLPKKKQKFLLRQLAERFPHVVPFSLTYRRVREFQRWLKNERPWFRTEPAKAAASDPLRSWGADYPLGDEMRLLAEAYQGRLTLLFLAPFDPKDPSGQTEQERLLQKLATANGVRFVTLRDKFQDMEKIGKSPYGFNNTLFNYGHWNRYGHAAAAQLLLTDLRNTGL
jgi:hypothetical protein